MASPWEVGWSWMPALEMWQKFPQDKMERRTEIGTYFHLFSFIFHIYDIFTSCLTFFNDIYTYKDPLHV